MKKFLSIFLICVMILSSLCITVSAVDTPTETWDRETDITQPEGEGTTESPYLIGTPEELLWCMDKMLDAAASDQYITTAAFKAVLTKDIDLSAKLWPTWDWHFAARRCFFDGQNYKITGMVQKVGQFTGLFPRTYELNVHNLTLEGRIFGTRTSETNLGVVTGELTANRSGMSGSGNKWQNVHVIADIDVDLSGNTAVKGVGGMIGILKGEKGQPSVFENCTVSGTIKVKGGAANTKIGGFFGSAQESATDTAKVATLSITDCINYADITFTSSKEGRSVGGFIGSLLSKGAGATGITRCVNYGDVMISHDEAVTMQNPRVAGFVAAADGVANGCVISYCANTGYQGGVSNGSGYGGISGFTGYVNASSAKIQNCFTTGSVIFGNGNLDDGPNGGYVTHAQISNSVANLSLDTLDGASIRLSGASSGIRYDSQVSKAMLDSLTAAGATVTFGTLITPTEYVTGAGEFTKHALDAYKASKGFNNDAYLDVKFDPTVNSWVDSDNGIFSGAIGMLLEDHYELAYSGVGYMTVTVNGLSFTVYGDYSDEAQSRTIAGIAEKAFADRAAAEGQTNEAQGYGYTNLIADEALKHENGDYSPFTEAELSFMKKYFSEQ